MKKIELNIHVESLANVQGDLTKIIHDTSGERWFEKPYENLKISLTYPFKTPYLLTIEKANNLSDILVPIAKTYKDIIYANSEQYGVWGHVFGDLWFEELTINDDGNCEIFIGN